MGIETKSAKATYHHGDLRQSLINAATSLLKQYGPEQFTMTDACKLAGVSKAAPYRHFANKNDLLKSVIEAGFEQMRNDMRQKAEGLTDGANEKIIAIGMAYIEFAVREPALFKLMFGNSMQLHTNEEEDAIIGKPTFQILLDQIIARTQLENLGELMDVAFPLWTLVHGASMLIIDDSYRRIYPDSDIEQMIRKTTEQLLLPFNNPS